MRRVYVIPESMKVEDAIPQTNSLGIGEIVHGIPPKIQRETNIKEEDLPMVYEEPEIPEEIARDLFEELDDLKSRLKDLEATRIIK